MAATKLDARSLYHLLKLADHVVQRATGPVYDRMPEGESFPLTIMTDAREIAMLKSSVVNVRQVLEHVTFEVDPPHAAVHNAVHFDTVSGASTERARRI